MASQRRQLVVVSDASWDSSAWQCGGAQMSWSIFAGDRPGFGEVCFVPPEFLCRCQTRESYIAVAELLAALVPLIRHLSLVKGAFVTSHLDSMTAICALVKGNSKAWDLANVSMVYHAVLTSARANTWFEWVPTASNPADGGSRVGVSCSVARALDIPLTIVPFPECLFDWLESGPTDVLAQIGGLVDRQ